MCVCVGVKVRAVPFLSNLSKQEEEGRDRDLKTELVKERESKMCVREDMTLKCGCGPIKDR